MKLVESPVLTHLANKTSQGTSSSSLSKISILLFNSSIFVFEDFCLGKGLLMVSCSDELSPDLFGAGASHTT